MPNYKPRRSFIRRNVEDKGIKLIEVLQNADSLHAIKIKIMNSRRQSGVVAEFLVTNPFIYKRENDENSKAQCEQRWSESLICIVLMRDQNRSAI
jgi:hypothetical protein